MFVITWGHIGALGTILGIIGSIIGWLWKTVSYRYDDKLDELKKTVDTQWHKIDEMREKAASRDDFIEWRHKTEAIEKSYVDRQYHQESLQNLTGLLKEAINSSMEPLRIEIKNLASQTSSLALQMQRERQ